jgi:hypothetical protein
VDGGEVVEDGITLCMVPTVSWASKARLHKAAGGGCLCTVACSFGQARVCTDASTRGPQKKDEEKRR